MADQYEILPGYRYPQGAKPDGNGVNFSILGLHATSAELLLYERPDSPIPFQVIKLDPDDHKTFLSWHVYVKGLPVGTSYAWRMDGPRDTKNTGFRFDPTKELLDPWAKAVTDHFWNRELASRGGYEGPCSFRAMVVDDGGYDWEGDNPFRRRYEETVIYEMHVGGFTRHPSSQVDNPGTFAGLIEKIPYLQSLGVTDVELLPVMAFDRQDVPPGAAQRGLQNYWGYSTHSFFCPHPGYCVTPQLGTHIIEFRDMVKALHKAGIGVILDVVFNHTAEGGAIGPIINFKGLGNADIYHLDPNNNANYLDFTGCGNSVNANHPVVADFLHDTLVYWVKELHVDGFRFDLASALCRGDGGEPLRNPPVLWQIELSDTLAYTRVIAEAWDAAGLYQVGGFPGFRWREWNGRYRDSIRRFVRGDHGLIGEVATRVMGSSDLYAHSGRLPNTSINFITCHDGFTLYDLLSYNGKHNWANGENNCDGCNDNNSWNCGAEGDTENPAILALRLRQAKNLFALLLLSQGVPMILAGDEVLQTQHGNNNAYCQDNELSWFDWNLADQNVEIFTFVQGMIAFRKHHSCLRHRKFLTGEPTDGRGIADVTWHGKKLHTPEWDDPENQFLAYTLAAAGKDDEDLHILFNMGDAACEGELPPSGNRIWHRAIDTSLNPPDDITQTGEQVPVDGQHYRVHGRSVVVLVLAKGRGLGGS